MQAYISKSLEGLDFRKVHGLSEYTDSEKPLVIFGMYRQEDFDAMMSHKDAVAIVWQGMDAKDINPLWVPLLRDPFIRHYSISHWITDSLTVHGIESEFIPITATRPDPHAWPRGESIYFYTPDYSRTSMDYSGAWMLEEIRDRTELKVIVGHRNKFNQSQLQIEYLRCFINLRLTGYDGCPNTNLEMGLMGRRSIFNGNIPHSIPWTNVDDICESIMREYDRRHEPNEHIANDISNFLKIKFP